jgi:hypothetical protein
MGLHMGSQQILIGPVGPSNLSAPTNPTYIRRPLPYPASLPLPTIAAPLFSPLLPRRCPLSSLSFHAAAPSFIVTTASSPSAHPSLMARSSGDARCGGCGRKTMQRRQQQTQEVRRPSACFSLHAMAAGDRVRSGTYVTPPRQ